MNRSFNDYAVSGVASSRSLFPVTASHRRGNSLSRDSDDRTLDLFSNNRRSISVASPDDLSDDRTASLKLGKISVGSAKPAKNGSEDLLTNADGGKHDYDWPNPPKTSSTTRSTSTTKSSRLSTNHVESNVTSRPARSSSVTRSSISYSHNNSYSSIRSSSNILNTSSASVSSYIRPSSPITRSSSISRPSTPSRTTTQSRPSTPSKGRSRPSTPNSRPQIAANSTSPSTLLTSRSSTPTRRTTISSSSPNSNLLASSVRALSNNGRTHTSASRPSSPSPRIRQQPSLVSSDFPNDTPPNLRTSLPDRPVSVGRSRPNPAITAKVNIESQGNGSFSRRASSPVVTRGRSVEPKGRSYGYPNGYTSEAQEPRKPSYVPDSPSRRNTRASTTTDSNGFGRSISKKSLDMAIKHMDIRNGPGNSRPLAGTVLYPQSIRSAASKIHATLNSSSGDSNGRLTVNNENGFTPEKPKYPSSNNGALENVKREENSRIMGRLREVDIFESSRYDAILLKEDLKNTNWLLSSDEKSDQGLLFDHNFESLPEPFGLS
ncbi:hypothetical protein V2J09_012146 [Rumex salicifolius]